MTDPWTTPAATAPARELDPDTAAAIEDVLAVADAWIRGEVPLADALTIALAEPRAVGKAFRHAWADRRRPALEALHGIEYDRRYNTVMTSFGRISRIQIEQIERHMASPDFDALRYRKAS